MRKARLACWLLPLAAASLGAAVAADPIQEAERWDRIFGQKEPRYRTEPNEFLGRMLARLESEKWLADADAGPGSARRALDLAMGDGRNALLEAEKGYAVTGLDISTVALEKARASAKARGLAIDVREADLARASSPTRCSRPSATGASSPMRTAASRATGISASRRT